MGLGSILVGVAIALLVGAYVGRPLRAASDRADRDIEAWVLQARAQRALEGEQLAEAVEECPQCGRPVRRHDRFCSGCGAPLQEASE